MSLVLAASVPGLLDAVHVSLAVGRDQVAAGQERDSARRGTGARNIAKTAGAGLAVLCLYAAVVLAAGGWALVRRDA